MAINERLVYSGFRQTQKLNLQLGLRVASHLALTDFRLQEPSEFSHNMGLSCR